MLSAHKILINNFIETGYHDNIMIEVAKKLLEENPEKFLQLMGLGDIRELSHNIFLNIDDYTTVRNHYIEGNRVTGIKALRAVCNKGLRECKEAADAEFYHLL